MSFVKYVTIDNAKLCKDLNFINIICKGLSEWKHRVFYFKVVQFYTELQTTINLDDAFKCASECMSITKYTYKGHYVEGNINQCLNLNSLHMLWFYSSVKQLGNLIVLHFLYFW